MLRVLFLFGVSFSLMADLRSIQAEPNLEKRSDLALAYAEDVIDTARQAHKASDEKAFAAAMKDMLDSVELSRKSLEDTGKAARRSPKYFKRAEMKTRTIIRRLDNLEKEVGFEDRAAVEQVVKRVHEIHDQILMNIMTEKHK
ncbi:MAG TPA: hypothetical protein VMZ52_14205 [Bryobacteraceae bacterium]|nr:hypothetical protein [Bryobacteraceae bacterium]